MRTIFYKKAAILTLIFGFISGFLTSYFSGEETASDYGSWIQSFYQCEEMELLLKSVFSGPLFVFTTFLFGLFIFGYLFVYPISFYWAYTFGFLITSTIICFGKESVLPTILKLPSISATCFLLCYEAAAAVKFSTAIFTNSEFKQLRIQTSQYLGKGLSFVFFSLITTAYETFLVPQILNL